MPDLGPLSPLGRGQQHDYSGDRDEDDDSQVLDDWEFLDADCNYDFEEHANGGSGGGDDGVEVSGEEEVDADGIVEDESHRYYLRQGRGTLDVPKAEQGYPVWVSLSKVGICRKRGMILISKACSKFCSWKSMANCLSTKKAHSRIIGMMDVLIFLMTTNLIMVPATKMAIRSLMNHASTNMSMSVAMMNTPITIAMLQIITGLSEQQARMSAKQRQRKRSEKSMAPQQAQSEVC